jgi:hypothetical protein
MGIPKQVEEAAELAEKTIALMNADESEGQKEEETDEQAGDNADTSEESESQQDDETIESEDAEEEDDQEEAQEDFEQKYKTLKGKYEAEVPRLHDELESLKSDVFSRLTDIAEKQAAPESSDKADEKGEEEEPEEILRFKEEFGEDLFNGLKAIMDLNKPEESKSVEEISSKVDSIEEKQVENDRKEFADYVSEKVDGDWVSAWEGKDPNFDEFLKQPDPSGLYTNGELLVAYSQAWDKDRFAKVLNLYYGKAESKQDPTPKKESKSKKEKEAIIAPNRSNTNEQPEAEEEFVWTPQAIKQFEQDDRRNKYDAETSKKMWDSLLGALANNKIISQQQKE